MPNRDKKNSAGETIYGHRILRDLSYGSGEYDESGEAKVDWKKWQVEYADENGFDKRNKEENGQYYIQVLLPQGTTLIRYGPEGGRYTAPVGTSYDELSLPYTEESQEYHEYEVIADSISVFCPVKQGRVAPMFGCPGGGVQYMHLGGSIRDLLREKVLKRVEL